MFQALRRNINPATILAFVALIFAVTGGAFAATGGAGSAPAKATVSTARAGSRTTLAAIVAKKKKTTSTRGPAGPKGATGATGPAGAQGAPGARGPQGPAGTNGTNGTGTPGLEGHEGKAGATGPQGPAGPTEFTVLPKGQTETGAWSDFTGAEGNAATTISFAIPLAKALGSTAVHFVGESGKEQSIFSLTTHEFEEGPTSACPGNAAEPAATPGNLCVYQGHHIEGVESLDIPETVYDGGIGPANQEYSAALFTPGTAVSGALIFLKRESGATQVNAQGTWAVTAEE